MKLTPEEFRTEIFSKVYQAQKQFSILVALREALAFDSTSEKYRRNLDFFSSVDLALFNSLIVTLYSLYETREDTVNFKLFIDQIEIFCDRNETVRYRSELNNIKPTWIRISVLRNELVGHLTNKATRGSTQNKANLTFEDVSKLLSHAKTLLSAISSEQFKVDIDFPDRGSPAVKQLFSMLTTHSAMQK